MKKMLLFLLPAIMLVFSCGTNKSTNEPYTEKRSVVKPEAVQVYEEKGTGADTGTLKVQLFETEESLNYRMISEYAGQNWEYLITFPNLDIMPKPELRKGPDPMSVHVGFLDADDQFNEFRMVKVENGNMVFERLKEYQVTPAKK